MGFFFLFLYFGIGFIVALLDNGILFPNYLAVFFMRNNH